ncbi:MAG TPA: hypothetical protein IAA23_02710, partial [Candidatus Helicobacter avistercoris]|nr:hypothetical protein [Candidatus Helicobacter avistercoris]
GVSVASANDATLEATTGSSGDVSVSGGQWQGTPPSSLSSSPSYAAGTNITFDGATNLNFIGDSGHNSYEVGNVVTTTAGKITINSTNASTTTTITGTISGAGGLSVAFFGKHSGNLTLTNKDATSVLASVDATSAGKLTLGDGTNKADATIASITGDKLSVVYGAGTASNLTLHGASNTLASVDATSAGKLTLGDGTNKADATIASITGDKLSVAFANTTKTNTGTLVLNGATNTLASISGSGTIELGGSSTALNVTTLDGADNLTFNLAGNVAERFPVAGTNLQTRTLTIANHQSTGDNSYVLLATATKVADSNKAYASYDATTKQGTLASAGGSDKIVITANGSKESKNTISLVMQDGDRITDEDRYVVLAEVSGRNKDKVTLQWRYWRCNCSRRFYNCKPWFN